jgi:hypothetical protein
MGTVKYKVRAYSGLLPDFPQAFPIERKNLSLEAGQSSHEQCASGVQEKKG